jgi:hypothetical protein
MKETSRKNEIENVRKMRPEINQRSSSGVCGYTMLNRGVPEKIEYIKTLTQLHTSTGKREDNRNRRERPFCRLSTIMLSKVSHPFPEQFDGQDISEVGRDRKI